MTTVTSRTTPCKKMDLYLALEFFICVDLFGSPIDLNKELLGLNL